MKNAVIYTRVSTEKQDTARQILDLEKWAKNNDYKIVATFQDVISGSTKASKRKGAKALFDYIKKNKVDIVLASEISRIGRSAIDVQKNIDTIVNKLKTNLFIHQQGMQAYDKDGRKNMTFKLITDVLANVAQMEREQMSDRIKSGLAAARKKGRVLGRPLGVKQTDATILKKYSHVVKELKTGLSLRKTAKLCDVSVNTVRKVQAALLAA
jgi:DNA invertase Pin-like site-specific DNA recombinase